MNLPEIPRSWLIAFLGLALVVMRFFGIDSWTTAALSLVIGYLTGKHIQNTSVPSDSVPLANIKSALVVKK